MLRVRFTISVICYLRKYNKLFRLVYSTLGLGKGYRGGWPKNDRLVYSFVYFLVKEC